MNRFGYTPVDMAKRFGHHKICQYINSVVKKENPAAKGWTGAIQFVKPIYYICLKVW